LRPLPDSQAQFAAGERGLVTCLLVPAVLLLILYTPTVYLYPPGLYLSIPAAPPPGGVFKAV
jgi:hypothetical protein